MTDGCYVIQTYEAEGKPAFDVLFYGKMNVAIGDEFSYLDDRYRVSKIRIMVVMNNATRAHIYAEHL